MLTTTSPEITHTITQPSPAKQLAPFWSNFAELNIDGYLLLLHNHYSHLLPLATTNNPKYRNHAIELDILTRAWYIAQCSLTLSDGVVPPLCKKLCYLE